MSASSPPQPPKAPSPVQPATPTTTIASASASTTTTSHHQTNPLPSVISATATTNLTSPSSSTLPTSHSVSEARTAVVASLSNMLDRKLQTRASTLHSNAAALSAQEREVEKATQGLRKEREKLEKEAARAERGLREIGSVQNWAEVLEREFLVLEETVRLANEGGGSGSGSGSCSCSECGEDVRMDDGDESDELAKAKTQEEGDDVVMRDGSGWSEASRSLVDGESSTTGTGTGQAKGSETASVSTLA